MRRRIGQAATIGEAEAVLIALVLVLFILGVVQGGFGSAVAAALVDGFDRVDAVRVVSEVQGMVGEGSMRSTLHLETPYESITLDGEDTLKLVPGTEADPVTVTLPRQFSYTVDDLSGRTICIQKQGMEIRFSAQCSPPQCAPGVCSASTRDTRSGPVPQWGYYCRSNAFTDTGFFPHYYGSDVCGESARTGVFVEINRFRCPDKVVAGDGFGCVVVATWRCSSDAAVIRITGPGSREHQESFSCTDSIQHKRVFGQFSVGPGDHWFTATLTADRSTTVREQMTATPPPTRGGPGSP